MSKINLEVLAEELYSHLRSNRVHAGVEATYDGLIEVEITWGDWKHDHLRCKWLAKEFFESKGLTSLVGSRITEEDGSDCYSAIHKFLVA